MKAGDNSKEEKMYSSVVCPKSNTIKPIDYTIFLSQWSWDLHMTFYFHETRRYRPVNLDYAIRKVKAFLWCEKRKGFNQIRYAGIVVGVGGGMIGITDHGKKVSTHCHVLLVSDPKYPKRFSGLSDADLVNIEIGWSHGELLIKRVYFNKGICGYLASDKNMDLRYPDTWTIEFFRPTGLIRWQNL
jgi:hypothetical protein